MSKALTLTVLMLISIPAIYGHVEFTLQEALDFDAKKQLQPDGECVPKQQILDSIVALNTWVRILENPEQLEADLEVLNRVKELMEESQKDLEDIEAHPLPVFNSEFVQMASTSQAMLQVSALLNTVYEKKIAKVMAQIQEMNSKSHSRSKSESLDLAKEIISDLDHLIEELDVIVEQKDQWPEMIKKLKKNVNDTHIVKNDCYPQKPRSIRINKHADGEGSAELFYGDEEIPHSVTVNDGSDNVASIGIDKGDDGETEEAAEEDDDASGELGLGAGDDDNTDASGELGLGDSDAGSEGSLGGFLQVKQKRKGLKKLKVQPIRA